MVPFQTHPELMLEQYRMQALKDSDQIEKLRKQVAKLKTSVTEKDKAIGKQKTLYKDLRTIRDKNKEHEKQTQVQEQQIRDLKSQLAQTSRDNVNLRKQIYKKTATEKVKKTLLKLEPVSNGWISPIDESITPIRHVIVSKKGRIVSQAELFD